MSKNKQGGRNLGNRSQSSSVAPQNKVGPRGSSSSTSGRENYLYAITSFHEQDSSPDVVTGMIKAITFDAYTLLDPGTSVSFVTPYVANLFEILLEKLCELFSDYTFGGESILAERVYHDCPISHHSQEHHD